MGASINPTTGAFTWTPTEAQGPNSYTFKVRVTDNGTPNLLDEEEITVTVAEVNQAPVLAAIGNKSIAWGNALTFTASATDADLPANTLTYSLDAGSPTGAAIDPSSGAFSWTPASNQVGSYTITVRVKDNGTPSLDDYETITVYVAKGATTLVYCGASNGQYSDPATMTATLTDNGGGPLAGTPIAGKTVTFTISTVSLTLSKVTDNSGVASGSLTLNGQPGSYTVASAFAGDGQYTPSSDADPFAITQEDARADYIGTLFASTGSGSSTTVPLSATIRDITAADPAPSPPTTIAPREASPRRVRAAAPPAAAGRLPRARRPLPPLPAPPPVGATETSRRSPIRSAAWCNSSCSRCRNATSASATCSAEPRDRQVVTVTNVP